MHSIKDVMDTYDPRLGVKEALNLPGLPDGIVAVAYREPTEGEFTFSGKIDKSSPNIHWSMLIVKPADGWEFVYSVTENCYRAVGRYPAAKKITAHFFVNNNIEEEAVRSVKSVAGFQGFE